MPNSRIDLLVGSDIGRWVIDEVEHVDVHTIVSTDPELRQHARDRGFCTADRPEMWLPGRCALSVHYSAVLTPAQLARWPAAYNLHPSYLPWGKGWWPVFWAIHADEPAGATLHRMTASVDAGPIVAQDRVDVRTDDTGGTLLARIRSAERHLFAAWWPRLVAGERLPERPQPPGGSKHSRSEVDALRGSTDDSVRRALDFG